MYLSLYLLISVKYYWLKYLFDYMRVKSESHSVVSDSLRPHGLVHGILQARTLEWVAYPFFRGSSRPRSQTRVSCIAGGFFTNYTGTIKKTFKTNF